MKPFRISLISVHNCYTLIIISGLLERTHGVPDDYCLAPLNKSNCGQPLTPVFTYWLPGSRCEIEFWRGCPTTNKFPNEYVCSHYCIGKLFNDAVDEFNIGPLKKMDSEQNVCDEEFNDGDCAGEPAEVYTYNKTSGMCVPVTWRGCESRNRFGDKEDCIERCQGNIKEEFEQLPAEEIEEINEVLDEIEPEEEEETEAEEEAEEDEAEDDPTTIADTTIADTTIADTTVSSPVEDVETT